MDINTSTEVIPDHHVDLGADQLEQLADGDLIYFTNLDAGWSVGLLGPRPNAEDDELARRYALQRGLTIVRFSYEQMFDLDTGGRVRVGRYVFNTSTVEDDDWFDEDAD